MLVWLWAIAYERHHQKFHLSYIDWKDWNKTSQYDVSYQVLSQGRRGGPELFLLLFLQGRGGQGVRVAKCQYIAGHEIRCIFASPSPKPALQCSSDLEAGRSERLSGVSMDYLQTLLFDLLIRACLTCDRYLIFFGMHVLGSIKMIKKALALALIG